MSIDAFSRSLHLLYGAASDSTLWPTALQSLEDVMNSVGANINLASTDPTKESAILTGRLDMDACALWVRDYMSICPRLAFTHRFKPKLFHDSMLMPESEMNSDPVYDFYRRHDVPYHIGSVLPDIDGYQVSISFQRTAAQGHVQSEDIRMFERIRPHLEQAITLANRLGSLEIYKQLSLSVLNMLPLGIIIVGDRSQVLFINDAADQIFSHGQYLRHQGGTLAACNLADRAAFARLLSGAIGLSRGEHIRSGGWLRLEGGIDCPALAVMAAPITDTAQLSFTERPAAVVLLQKIGFFPQSTEPMLVALFGLTPTEARLACLLANGERIQGAADILRQTVSTARIHLKAIFRKMEINRQQDLVFLVSKLAAPLPNARE